MNKDCVWVLSVMYTESLYAPKISKNMMGESIRTLYDVMQGRRSSNLFSFFVSDMPISLRNINSNDFIDPYNLIQLADDFGRFFETLLEKFVALFAYSDDKFQIPNVKKTYFADFAENLITTRMHEKENTFI